jgi:hypothetical protein
VTQQSDTRVAEAEAALAQANTARSMAISARDLAKLNLTRTVVRASVDGTISDQSLRPGNYVSPGKAVMGLVDSGSLRVEGYFEETKLPHVRVGQIATIRLMGEHRLLKGHVTSIAMAIEDHDRTGSANLLPAINPSFSWVRLPQRVPVRIAIDEHPAGVALIAGRTASVTLAPDDVPLFKPASTPIAQPSAQAPAQVAEQASSRPSEAASRTIPPQGAERPRTASACWSAPRCSRWPGARPSAPTITCPRIGLCRSQGPGRVRVCPARSELTTSEPLPRAGGTFMTIPCSTALRKGRWPPTPTCAWPRPISNARMP